MSTIYVIDRRPQFDISWAVSGVNTRYTEPEAIELAKEWATKSCVVYYIHRLVSTDTTWQAIGKVTPPEPHPDLFLPDMMFIPSGKKT